MFKMEFYNDKSLRGRFARRLPKRWPFSRIFFSAFETQRLDRVFNEVFAGYAIKKRMIEVLRQDVETLVCGSSHAYYGYWAQANEVNIGEPSEDLRATYEKLLYWFNLGLPRLRQIVLFVDIFSAGNALEKSSECYRLIPYEYLYGMQRECFRDTTAIGLSYSDAKIVFYDRIAQYRPSVDPSYRGCFWGVENCSTYRTPDSDVGKRVEAHLKLSKGNMGVYAEKIIGLARTHNVDVVLVESPLREDFEALLPLTVDEIYSELQKTVPSWDGLKYIMRFGGTKAFQWNEFLDMDHLNEFGARKLASLVRDFGGVNV